MADPAIDRAALDQLIENIGGDRTFLIELIYAFLVDAPRLIASMWRGVETNDAEMLRRAAHTLKSNSANFGALDLSQRCKQVEDAGKRGVLDEVAPQIVQLEIEFDRVKSALAKVREG